MARASLRAIAAGALAIGVLAHAPAAEAGGWGACTVTGTAAGTTTDLSGEAIWHLRSSDRPTITFVAAFRVPEPGHGLRTYGHSVPLLDVIAHDGLGLARPISASGAHPGTVADLDLSAERIAGRRFDLLLTVAGPPNPQWLRDYGVSVPSDTCGWSGTIVLDDVQPLLTVLGGGASVVALLAAIIVVLGIRTRGRWQLRLSVGLFGAIGWAAAGSAADQFGSGAEASKWLIVANLSLTPVVALLSAFLVGRGARRSRDVDLDPGDAEPVDPAR